VLLQRIRDSVRRKNLKKQTDEELYSWFTNRIRENLHVIFTMNPTTKDFHNRSTTSPALFNRCVLDWFGEWSSQALFQVGKKFTESLSLSLPNYSPPIVMAENFDMRIYTNGPTEIWVWRYIYHASKVYLKMLSRIFVNRGLGHRQKRKISA